MIFNSIEFAVFLPVVLALYFVLSTSMQNAMLVLASYVFYGWWDYRFLLLLGFSTVVDFFCAHAIVKSDDKGKKLFLLISCVSNLGVLAFFKYFSFFVDTASVALTSLGIEVSPLFLNIVLPMGISFYTFQTLSYTVDVYRGELEPCRNLLTFALYVSYFPQLVAGPIERACRLIPQLQNKRRVTADFIQRGFFLILLGLFKKVGVADAIAPLVDARFNNPDAFEGADLLFGVYLFAIQIYCDFSGYSDIARGTSRLFGIELMENFRQPYFATTITEFWRRWHISLSSWLRDYLYIPLGGNRLGAIKTYRNLMTTMLLGGLWHGASWVFVLWGGLHGLYLSVFRRFRHRGETQSSTPAAPIATRLIGWFTTFHLVCFAWIFFRADSFTSASSYLGSLASWSTIHNFGNAPWFSGRIIALLSILLAVDLLQFWTYPRLVDSESDHVRIADRRMIHGQSKNI